MFFHNFKYTFKVLFKNKMLIFWTFAFPIILGTFFNMAFSDIENSEKLDIIPIAIVSNESFESNPFLKETFRYLSDEDSETQLFSTKYTNEEEAKSLLEEGDISGYLLVEDTSKVVVSTNGINETIFKSVVDEVNQNSQLIGAIAKENIEKELKNNPSINPEAIYKNAIELVQKEKANIKNISSSNLSYTMIEFYTLIAMACLYGGILGTVAINQSLANMSSTGKRVSVSPTKKRNIIFSSVLAGYLTQLIGLVLLFLYTIFVLKVDYGTHFPEIVVLSLLGSLAGLSLGIVVACLIKSNEDLKVGIMISVTMLGCFLSGMMGITMKYIVDKNIPIVNKINPVNMITDGFYSLYYYDTFDRFYGNIIGLFLFSALCISISIWSIRRQKYDSI